MCVCVCVCAKSTQIGLLGTWGCTSRPPGIPKEKEEKWEGKIEGWRDGGMEGWGWGWRWCWGWSECEQTAASSPLALSGPAGPRTSAHCWAAENGIKEESSRRRGPQGD